MDYHCGKYGNCSLSSSGAIVRTHRQTRNMSQLTPDSRINYQLREKLSQQKHNVRHTF